MRAVLFTMLVSFNLVACVTSDEDAADVGAISEGDVVELDVAYEDQLRPDNMPKHEVETTVVVKHAEAVTPVTAQQPVVREAQESEQEMQQLDAAGLKIVEDGELETLERTRLHEVDLNKVPVRN